MFNFLKASPDATEKVPDNQITQVYKHKQLGVIFATSLTYISYYIIRLIFRLSKNPL